MSWEAVTWANNQKLKKSYEQIVLLVLANCADPNGEAFVKWPGRDHWWIYLSQRTRLPKSSLFRHLNTIVALGLGERSMLVLADGSRRPTFKLNMDATFDIDQPEDQQRYQAAFSKASPENESPVGTESADDLDHNENDNDISDSRDGETEIASQSPVGTGSEPAQSPVGTEPFPVLRLQETPYLVPKILPPSPQAGGSPGPTFEDFTKAWKKPIDRLSVARSVWDRIETIKRGEAIAAAQGYWAFVGQQRKDYPPLSAQTFLREAAGWSQWLRYLPEGGGSAAASSGYPCASVEGRAVAVLYDIVGAGDFFRTAVRKADRVYYRLPVTPRLAALAQAPAPTEWATLARNQAAAWETFVAEHLTLQVRQRLREGSRAPWPWPPRKDGTLTATGPPDALATEDDLANFK
jgi:hypothetical protein